MPPAPRPSPQTADSYRKSLIDEPSVLPQNPCYAPLRGLIVVRRTKTLPQRNDRMREELAKRKTKTKQPDATSANVGYEAQLWQMADALRCSMDAAEYKHVVLGLIFLKYISDAFEEQHAKLVAEQAKGA